MARPGAAGVASLINDVVAGAVAAAANSWPEVAWGVVMAVASMRANNAIVLLITGHLSRWLTCADGFDDVTGIPLLEINELVDSISFLRAAGFHTQ